EFLNQHIYPKQPEHRYVCAGEQIECQSSYPWEDGRQWSIVFCPSSTRSPRGELRPHKPTPNNKSTNAPPSNLLALPTGPCTPTVENTLILILLALHLLLL